MAAHCSHQLHLSCSNCNLSTLCLPLSLEVDDLDRFDSTIHRGLPLQKDEQLYRAGDSFTSIYAIRSGSIKCSRITEDGEEQITGFYLPGEIFGLDGLSASHYLTTAIALETSAMCELPFNKLESLSREIPSLQRHFFQLMSREINADQELISLLSKNTAEERLAALLLSLSSRYKRQGLSASQFVMPMSRMDLGNYLGLTIETVSRTFSLLKKQGFIEYKNRNIRLKDPVALQKIAPTFS